MLKKLSQGLTSLRSVYLRFARLPIACALLAGPPLGLPGGRLSLLGSDSHGRSLSRSRFLVVLFIIRRIERDGLFALPQPSYQQKMIQNSQDHLAITAAEGHPREEGPWAEDLESAALRGLCLRGRVVLRVFL
jgi:hypothetical protein